MNRFKQFEDIRGPFLRGYDAHKDGWPITDNPYSKDNGWGEYRLHAEWNRGYLQGQTHAQERQQELQPK